MKEKSRETADMIFAIIFASICLNAQNVAINDDGALPNSNAMLDVKSPSTGNGKGLLIPRVTNAQMTTSDSSLAGGLLDDSGNLRGGAAQGLLVYKTDVAEGFYYNTSTTSAPTWVFLGVGGPDPAAQRTSLGLGSISTQNVSYTLTSGAGTAGQILISNGDGTTQWSAPATSSLPLAGTVVTVGTSAVTANDGVSVGVSSASTDYGVAVGFSSNASAYGTALGYVANGYDSNVAVGYRANAYAGTGSLSGSVTVGYQANSYPGNGKRAGGVAVGYYANARHNTNTDDAGAVAVGHFANGYANGVAIGQGAAAYASGVAIGYKATGSSLGVGLGYMANAYVCGSTVGYRANSGNQGYAFAKGGYSRCMRYNEEWKGADTLSEDPATGQLTGYNKFGYGTADFCGSTNSSSATELFLGATAGKRFTLQDNSSVSFNMLVTAIDTNTGASSVWSLAGGIKRRAGAATASIIGTVQSIMSLTQGTLTTAPSLSADTTNGSLKLTVTGIAATTVKWNATIFYSEARE